MIKKYISYLLFLNLFCSTKNIPFEKEVKSIIDEIFSEYHTLKDKFSNKDIENSFKIKCDRGTEDIIQKTEKDNTYTIHLKFDTAITKEQVITSKKDDIIKIMIKNEEEKIYIIINAHMYSIETEKIQKRRNKENTEFASHFSKTTEQVKLPRKGLLEKVKIFINNSEKNITIEIPLEEKSTEEEIFIEFK